MYVLSLVWRFEWVDTVRVKAELTMRTLGNAGFQASVLYRMSQKTLEFSDKFEIVFVIN